MEINGVKITPNTRITGLIGYPVDHSLSPYMHNAAFRYLSLEWVYLPLPVKSQHLKHAIKGMVAFNIVGVNVTIPHKERVIEYLDELSPEAEFCGAVNTICQNEGRLKGYNTDHDGFITSLNREKVTVCSKSAFILGAGGAARAVSMALAKEGIARLFLCDIIKNKAKTLQRELKNKYRDIEVILVGMKDGKVQNNLEGIDILINATPIGMKPKDPLLIEPSFLHPGLLVYDLIYNPPQTPLLKVAKDRGARVINGLSMLLNQGALSFTLWTKKKAPIEIMERALYNALDG